MAGAGLNAARQLTTAERGQLSMRPSKRTLERLRERARLLGEKHTTLECGPGSDLWLKLWQWVMGDIAKTVRTGRVPGYVQHLDGMLGPLAAYLDALKARVAALERRSSAVPLMAAADAGRHARVNV